MPQIGFGTYPLCGEKLKTALRTAFDCGCRLIDTAHSYPNEESIGECLNQIYKESGYRREQLFVTSKIGDKIDDRGVPVGYYFYNSDSCPNHNVKEVVYKQVGESLKKLQTNYIDLLLIHWPYNDCLEEIWLTFEELYRQGVVKSIGVSNCKIRHMERIKKVASVMPMVNQLYVSPLNIQSKTLDYCNKNNIVLESYSPLMFINSLNPVTASVEIKKMCKELNKTLAQVVLRWNIQRGVIPIPKSGTPFRIQQNYDIFDFELTSAQMKFIDSFNEDYQYLSESKFCPGY